MSKNSDQPGGKVDRALTPESGAVSFTFLDNPAKRRMSPRTIFHRLPKKISCRELQTAAARELPYRVLAVHGECLMK